MHQYQSISDDENEAFGPPLGTVPPIHRNISIVHSVLRIRNRIHRIHMFLGLLDPDPLVRGKDPDPDTSITKQK